MSQAAAPACSYTVSPTSLSFGRDVGDSLGDGEHNRRLRVDVRLGPFVGDGDWQRDGIRNGHGDRLDQQRGSRSAPLTVAGKTVTVSQAPRRCSYTVSPTSLSFRRAATARCR